MSEYFIAVNHSTEQFIDPNDFYSVDPTTTDDATDHERTEIPKRRRVTAIKHIDWAVGHSTWVLPYMLAESGNTGFKDTYGHYFGSWSGDAVTLIGSSTDAYDKITNEWENISHAVFDEARQSNTDILNTSTCW